MSLESSQAADANRLLLRRLRRTFGLGIVYLWLLSGCITVLQLTVPFFIIQVYDRVINSQSLDTLRMLVVLCAGALILYGVLEFIRSITFLALANQLVRRLNLPTIDAALRRTLERETTDGSQSLRDLNELRGFVTGNAISAPLEAAWSPIFLVVMFALHPVYGIVGVVALLILIGMSLISDLLSRQIMREANDANIKNVSRVGSTLRHAEAIESMGMLPALARRWRASQAHALDLFNHGHSRNRGMHALTRTLRYGIQIAALSIGAYLVISGSASPGSMIAATIILGRLLLPFDNVMGDARQWVSALSAWRRIHDMLSAGSSMREIAPTPRCQGALVVDRLVYMAPGLDLPILKGVSFEIAPGEVLGIVGPSASGKSTLARLLVGVLRGTSGGVYLDGHSVYLWERGSFGDMAGYLPQSVSLLDGTIRDNIARMRDGDPRLVLEAARTAGVHDMIGRLPLGYDTPVGDGRLTLSGGQKQRVALARALYGRPRLLILDEPNANLDAEGEQALLRAIEQARADEAIVILIAHRMSMIQAVDKLLVLQDGRVAQFGERTEVVRSMEAGQDRPALVPKQKGGAA